MKKYRFFLSICLTFIYVLCFFLLQEHALLFSIVPILYVLWYYDIKRALALQGFIIIIVLFWLFFDNSHWNLSILTGHSLNIGIILLVNWIKNLITRLRYAEKKAQETTLEIQELVSQYIEQNKELGEQMQKSQEADRLKTAFLANMSHEIRTPLNAIIGFSKLLRTTQQTPEKQHFFLDIVIKNSNNLLHLLNDIIDVAKIESQQLTIVKGSHNINQIITDLYQQLKVQYQHNHIGFILSLHSNEKVLVHADINRLQQIFVNLVNNAFKFTDKGSITIGYHISNNIAECFVRDTGVGIPPQKLEHIFSRFGQVDESLTRNKGGAGLGLTISRSLVELMGGTMRVESKEGQGSTFFFTLPLDSIQVTQNKAVAQNNTDKKLLLEDKTILVAEDEQYNFILIEEYLKPTGVKFIHVTNGKDAVAACKSNPAINMVLMDISMPLMDGYEATRQIKSHKSTIPIVAQTASAMVGAREKSFEAGCNDYISKPISDDELIAVVKKYLL